MKDSLNHLIQKIKSFCQTGWERHREEIFISLIIIFVGSASYGAGVLSAKTGHPPIEIRNNGSSSQATLLEPVSSLKEAPQAQLSTQGASAITSVKEGQTSGSIVGTITASKNGVAYYLPGCSGSSRILDKNKIYFKTEDEAKAAGYHIAGNCKK